MTSMTDMRAAIGEMLREALEEQAFSLPLHLAMVSANGSAMVVRYTAGENRVLVEHIENGTLDYPIHFMLSDRQGKAALHEYRPAAGDGATYS